MALFRQGIALLRLWATQPTSFRAAVSWRPFSITSYEMLRNLRAQGIRPVTFIDGGANIGQFARAALEMFPEATVISFEPLPEVAAVFRSHLAGEPRCHLIESALGEAEGTIPFHQQAYDLASSALPPMEGESAATIEVSATRLDAALKSENLDEPILLKLDVQGYELVALSGAEQTLPRIRWVLLEVAFQPSYEGEATFEQIYDFLRNHGFRFLRPVDTLVDRKGQIIQMDVLFERVR